MALFYSRMPSSDESTPTREDHLRDYQSWVSTLRDPAEKTTEGIRRLQTSNRSAVAEYVIAPLPDGRYAMRHHFAYRCGNSSGKSCPWQPFPSRDDCVTAFLESTTRHFGHPLDHTASYLQHSAQTEMLSLLSGTGLFGYLEPDPLPVDDPLSPTDAEEPPPEADE